MNNLFSKVFKSVIDYKIANVLLSFQFESYLLETGWINSFRSQMPVDLKNQPLPWVTYPFIDFISPRLNKTLDLFEFGSGNSTLFYSKLVNQVYSVENDKEWYTKIKRNIPDNVELAYQEVVRGGDYSRYPTGLNIKFDLIIVDGRDRVNCCTNSLKALKEGGVVILDDSERHEYKAALDFFKANDYKEIDFWGIAPGGKMKKCTSIFYREKNCLGI